MALLASVGGCSSDDAPVIVDSDNDGVSNLQDAFPNNASESFDSDGDGVGNNSDQFPNDASESFDSDGDGVGNNSDQFPNDASESLDTDGDGIGDNSDAFSNDALESVDSDGDGVGNNTDAFPTDITETTDSDGDGIGNNSDIFPNDPAESVDSDGDGIGNNSDIFPNDPTEILDSDDDGVGNNSDEFPNDASEAIDTDGDGVGNNRDAFPNDASESIDTDGDEVGNNADVFPNDFTEYIDSDGDGFGDNTKMLYANSINDNWSPRAWDDQYWGVYGDGETVNHITWKEVDTEEDNHQSVLDISFNNDTSGHLFLSESNITRDFSEFSNGYLIFDIKPLSYGNIAQELIIAIHCVFPCSSADYNLGRPALNRWTQIKVPVATLLEAWVDIEGEDRALDISKVFTGFNIFATKDNQQGVHIQLDNIHWKKSHLDNQSIIFDESLEPVFGGFGSWDNLIDNNQFVGNGENHVTWSVIDVATNEHNNVIDVQFNQTDVSGVFYIYADGYPATTIDYSVYSDGILVFDLNVISYADTSGLSVELVGKVEIPKQTTNVWKTIRIPISDFINVGLDVTEVGIGLNILPQWGENQAGVHFQLDNIRWETSE
jgi:hypothetical protein